MILLFLQMIRFRSSLLHLKKSCLYPCTMSTAVDPPTSLNIHEHKLSRPQRLPTKPKVLLMISIGLFETSVEGFGGIQPQFEKMF